MKILVISPNIPCPRAGFSTRNYYLLKSLAARHTVSLFALSEGEEYDQEARDMLASMTRHFQVIARPRTPAKRWVQLACTVRKKPYILSEYYVEEMQRTIDEFMSCHECDCVVFESSLIAGYHLPPHTPVIIDQHNLEYEILLRTSEHEGSWARRWYSRTQGYALKPAEIEMCRNARMLLVTSEREQAELASALPGSAIRVVPNGVDSETFRPGDVQREREKRIVFTGAMDYYPNVDAVRFFAQRCWPLIQEQVPAATWQIVGKNPLPAVWQLATLPGVTVTGSVPDTRPYLEEASVAIAPLRIGSGTRLKILEAFALRKAVVSTSVGCEGLAVETDQHLLIEDQPEAFARAVIALLRQPERRQALGRAGRMLVEERYSWEQCGKRLLQFVAEMEPLLHGR